MKELPSDYISQNSYDDAIDRRGFLKCMAWAGTGFSAQTDPGGRRSHSAQEDARVDQR
jgi:hypothetical protein